MTASISRTGSSGAPVPTNLTSNPYSDTMDPGADFYSRGEAFEGSRKAKVDMAGPSGGHAYSIKEQAKAAKASNDAAVAGLSDKQRAEYDKIKDPGAKAMYLKLARDPAGQFDIAKIIEKQETKNRDARKERNMEEG